MKTFWEKDEESPFTLEKIDEEQIREAEGTLGVTLPDTYKKLILEWNGGFTVGRGHSSSEKTIVKDEKPFLGLFECSL